MPTALAPPTDSPRAPAARDLRSYFLLPDTINLDTLLVEDAPKHKPGKPSAPGMGRGGRGRARGRGRGRGGPRR
jgi:hypothetical protein